MAQKKKVFSPLFAASSQNTLLWASREYQTALLYRWISFWVGQNEAVLRENTYLEVLSLTCKICQIPWWHHKGSVVYKLCLKEQIFFFSSQCTTKQYKSSTFNKVFPQQKVLPDWFAECLGFSVCDSTEKLCSGGKTAPSISQARRLRNQNAQTVPVRRMGKIIADMFK